MNVMWPSVEHKLAESSARSWSTQIPAKVSTQSDQPGTFNSNVVAARRAAVISRNEHMANSYGQLLRGCELSPEGTSELHRGSPFRRLERMARLVDVLGIRTSWREASCMGTRKTSVQGQHTVPCGAHPASKLRNVSEAPSGRQGNPLRIYMLAKALEH